MPERKLANFARRRRARWSQHQYHLSGGKESVGIEGVTLNRVASVFHPGHAHFFEILNGIGSPLPPHTTGLLPDR